MEDLISRKTAIDVIDKIFPADPMRNDYTQGITCGAALAMEFVKQLPPAEPKKAKWSCSDDIYETAICTACDWNSQEPFDYILKNFNFCPNCGAKMEG